MVRKLRRGFRLEQHPIRMTLIVRFILQISLLLQANLLWAEEIYRTESETGLIEYSDTPSEHAVKISTAQHPYRYKVTIETVYDGDTITTTSGQKIRLLGINAPEIESRYRSEEAGGIESAKWLKSKLEGQSVYLEYDHLRQDKYNRTLAHIFTLDGEHINLSLIKNGLAFVTLISPNLRYEQALISAQTLAEREQIGLWQMKEYQVTPLEPSSSPTLKNGWVRLAAVVQSVRETRKYVRLRLSQHLEIRIAKSLQHSFPDINSYLNRRIEVRGWPHKRGEHYEIDIKHPSAIVFNEED